MQNNKTDKNSHAPVYQLHHKTSLQVSCRLLTLGRLLHTLIPLIGCVSVQLCAYTVLSSSFVTGPSYETPTRRLQTNTQSWIVNYCGCARLAAHRNSIKLEEKDCSTLGVNCHQTVYRGNRDRCDKNHLIFYIYYRSVLLPWQRNTKQTSIKF